MNEPNEPSGKTRPALKEAPPAQPGHETVVASNSGRPWVLAMAAGVMLMIGLVVGTILWRPPDMRPFVEPFLQSVSQQDYAKAYTQIGPEWRGLVSEKVFADIHKILHEQLGDFRSFKQIDLQVKEHPVLGEINIVIFKAHYEKGDANLTATLRKTPTGWSLLDVGYDTPLLSAPAVLDKAKPKAPAPAPLPVPSNEKPAQEVAK